MNDNDPGGQVYAPNPDLRAGDQDRESVAQRLRGHHADGRLDTDEFAQRVDRCYQARTLGELDRLLADLPRAPAAERSSARRPEARQLVAIIPMIMALAAISALTGRPVFWLAFPIAFLARRFTHTRRYAPSTLTAAPHPGSAGHGIDAPAI